MVDAYFYLCSISTSHTSLESHIEVITVSGNKLRPHLIPYSCRPTPDIGYCLAFCVWILDYLLWNRNAEYKKNTVSGDPWLSVSHNSDVRESRSSRVYYMAKRWACWERVTSRTWIMQMRNGCEMEIVNLESLECRDEVSLVSINQW